MIRLMGRVRKPSQDGKPKPIHATIVGDMAIALDEYAEEYQVNITNFIREAVKDKLISIGRFPRKQIKETK